MAKCMIILGSLLLAFSPPDIAKNQVGEQGPWLTQAQLYNVPDQAPPPIPKPRGPKISPLARAYFELGKNLYWANQHNEAIRNFKAAVAASPKWGEAYLYLGLSLSIMEDLIAADIALRKALDDLTLTSKEKALALKLRGITAQRQGNFERAEAYFRRGHKFDPSDITLTNSLALLYAEKGQNLDEALKLVNYSLSKSPANGIDRFAYLDTRAWVFFKRGQYIKAENDALESLRLLDQIGHRLRGSPSERYDMSEIHYHLGEIYLAQRKTSLARSHFRKAVRFDKVNTPGKRALQRLDEIE